MGKWDIPSLEQRVEEIRLEIGRLLTEQTELLRKRRLTAEELRRYEEFHQRVQELFDEWQQLRNLA
jgi:hypothetical protein